MPNLHIIPNGARWNVREENGEIVAIEDTQEQAGHSARTWLREHGGGEVYTHRDEGEFARIRRGDAIKQ